MVWIDQQQLKDAKTMSQPEYFVKYGEHPAIIIRQAGEKSDK